MEEVRFWPKADIGSEFLDIGKADINPQVLANP